MSIDAPTFRRRLHRLGKAPNARRGQAGGRGQHGALLIEVMLTVALGGLLLAAFLAWTFVSMTTQESTRMTNIDSFGLGLASVHFPADVASSWTAVTPAQGVVEDCPDPLPYGLNAADPGVDLLVAMVTPDRQRITYITVPSNERPGTFELWRRECPNQSDPGDPTLNDPWLERTDGSGDHSSQEMAEGLVDADEDGHADARADCPSESGIGPDPRCRTVAVTAAVDDRPTAPVVKGTRRTNIYASNDGVDSKPEALFTYSPDPIERHALATFDGTVSRDRRAEFIDLVDGYDSAAGAPAAYDCIYDGNGCLSYSWTFHPNFVMVDSSNSGKPVVKYTAFVSGPTQVAVSLTVTSQLTGYSDTVDKLVTIIPRRPIVGIPDHAPPQSMPPITGMRDTPVHLVIGAAARGGGFGRFGSPGEAEYTIDWGDGNIVTEVGAGAFTYGTPYEADCSTVNPYADSTGCALLATPGDPNPSDGIDHAYTAPGTYVVRVTVTDSDGDVSLPFITTIAVEDNVIYVNGVPPYHDDLACGETSLDPCRSIQYGMDRAVSEGKTQVNVVAGEYVQPLTLRNGVSLEGGWDADFLQQYEWDTQDYSHRTVVKPPAPGDVNFAPNALVAQGITEPTSISNISFGGTDLPANSQYDNTIVDIRGGTTGLTMDHVVVGFQYIPDGSDPGGAADSIPGGTGPSPTAILVREGSTVHLTTVFATAGSPVASIHSGGLGLSAYGLRVVGSSTAYLDGGRFAGANALEGPSGSDLTGHGAIGCPGGAVGESRNGANGCGGGGAGGDGGDDSGDNGDNGAPGSPGGAPGGAGGESFCFSSDRGHGGQGGAGANNAGSAGNGGAGATNDPGAVPNLGLWQLSSGGNGVDGAAGRPGGGGGGGGGTCAGVDGGGGGGGAGGGSGGQGNQSPGHSGGGSFGIYAINSIVLINQWVQAVAYDGGDGGDGGNGADGGRGGRGGAGGDPSCCEGSGGGGGGGGGGGAGGGGSGGGAGGPSIAIFHRGSGYLYFGQGIIESNLEANSPGDGGVGGAGGTRGSGWPGGGGGDAGGIDGEDGGHGGHGANGDNGSAGAEGADGLRYLVWNNGSTVAP